jgi:MOSC domain-containing protein YiiM
VRECPLPESPGCSLAARSLAACLAGILEVPVDDVPCTVARDPFAPVAWWLATRNLGLVPIADAEGFQWGGWWIARLEGAGGRPAEPFVVMAGVPSGLVWAPAGTGARAAAPVREGWVLAPPQLGGHAPDDRVAGVVEGLFRATLSTGPMEALERAPLVAGVGVEGDRYAAGRGRFSASGRSGQELTLIEAEAVEALGRDHGVELAAADARRNVVTRGIDLNALVGHRFRLGEVACQGQRLAEPCSWLQQLTPPGTLRGLVHCGGLRADILVSGVVAVGDRVEAEA